MKLGFNSVLFGNFDLEKAFIAASEIGCSGIELSALDPAMSEHINESDPVSQNISTISALINKYELPVTAIERAKHDLNSWEYIVQLAEAIGCPLINLGPGGKIDPNGVPIAGESFDYAIESLKRHSEISNKYNFFAVLLFFTSSRVISNFLFFLQILGYTIFTSSYKKPCVSIPDLYLIR